MHAGAGEQPVQGAPALRVGESRERAADGAAHAGGGEASTSRSRPGEARGRPAKALLAELAVRPPAPRKGYARDQFGHAWVDVDKNGCDTRDDILRRDLTGVRIEKGSRDCVVEKGRLADPYTGASVVFERGRGASVDIDHVIALADAWATGAAAWEPAQRIALANDPLNLLAVDASANRAKGSHNAAEWLPPDERYHCAYVARQIAVKAKYGLWVTVDEHAKMTEVLSACPDELAPTGDAPTRAPVATASARRVDEVKPPATRDRSQDQPKPATKTWRKPDPDYGSCKNAKAHGAGPYRRDVDPEYHYYRDGDGDGVVCE